MEEVGVVTGELAVTKLSPLSEVVILSLRLLKTSK